MLERFVVRRPEGTGRRRSRGWHVVDRADAGGVRWWYSTRRAAVAAARELNKAARLSYDAEAARAAAHACGEPWTDPRTGITYNPPRPPQGRR
jgi:hypothetical protein